MARRSGDGSFHRMDPAEQNQPRRNVRALLLTGAVLTVLGVIGLTVFRSDFDRPEALVPTAIEIVITGAALSVFAGASLLILAAVRSLGLGNRTPVHAEWRPAESALGKLLIRAFVMTQIAFGRTRLGRWVARRYEGLTLALTRLLRTIAQTPLARWFTSKSEDWYVAAGVTLSGPAALALWASWFFRGTPQFAEPDRWEPIFLGAYGLLWVSVALFVVESFLCERAVENRKPIDSLSAGQFTPLLAVIVLLGTLATAGFLATFSVSLILSDSISAASSPGWKKAVPWIAGVLCGFGALGAFVHSPIAVTVQWLGQRRALDKMRTEALLKLADAVSSTRAASEDSRE